MTYMIDLSGYLLRSVSAPLGITEESTYSCAQIDIIAVQIEFCSSIMYQVYRTSEFLDFPPDQWHWLLLFPNSVMFGCQVWRTHAER